MPLLRILKKPDILSFFSVFNVMLESQFKKEEKNLNSK